MENEKTNGEHEKQRSAVDDDAEASDHQPSEDAADHPVLPSEKNQIETL